MVDPDFEEKQFEGAFNAELAAGKGRVFTPGLASTTSPWERAPQRLPQEGQQLAGQGPRRRRTQARSLPPVRDSIESVLGLLADRVSDVARLDLHVSEILGLIAGEALNRRVDLAIEGIEDEGSAAAVALTIRMRLVGLALAESPTSWWLFEL